MNVLSKLAFTLILVVLLFAALTQRAMISWEVSVHVPFQRFVEFAELASLNTSQSSNLQTIANLSIVRVASVSEGGNVVKPTIIPQSIEKKQAAAPLVQKKASPQQDKHVQKKKHVNPLYQDPQVRDFHPPYSPRPGTDIDQSHLLAILKCPNQSRCIVPQLQLTAKFKIYFCKHPARQGIRFYFLSREGFILHPNVQLVEEEDMGSADYVVYLPGSAPWHLTECKNTSLAKKLIVLDEFDGHTLFFPRPSAAEMELAYGKGVPWYYMYFKRSFVARMDGRFLRYPHLDSHSQPEIYPMTYSIAEAYVQDKFNFVREVEILCTLRGSAKMTTRQRVQDWIAEYASSRNITNVITSQVNGNSRGSVSKSYFQHMYNSKIIVTVNPANWEGDFRLWESMASGALVMVDPLFVPVGFPLIDGKHIVYFSNQAKDQLWEKLDYFRANPDKAREIAIAGYLHAMKHHRTVNMVDYILRSAHLKQSSETMEESTTHPVSSYVYTAQYLNAATKLQMHSIKSSNQPGHYDSISMYNHTHLSQ